MNILKNLVLVGVSAVFVATHSNADSSGSGKTFAQEGFYVAPALGGSVVQDINNNSTSGSGTIAGGAVSGVLDASLVLDAGFRFDVPLGYRVNEWFSVEFAPGVIVNPMDSMNFNGTLTVGSNTFSGGTSADVSGYLVQVPLLVNFILTIPTNSEWEPFVGGGVGGLFSSMSFNKLDAPGGTSIDLSGENSTAWALGYSALAGLNYHFSRDISIGVIYKFTGTGDQNYSGSTTASLINTTGTFTHSVQANATIRF